jgi:hypothetical protein
MPVLLFAYERNLISAWGFCLEEDALDVSEPASHFVFRYKERAPLLWINHLFLITRHWSIYRKLFLLPFLVCWDVKNVGMLQSASECRCVPYIMAFFRAHARFIKINNSFKFIV